MARPYSQDLRDRVVSSVASGRTCRATAALFGVSVANVVKWSQRERLLARIAEKADLTLRTVVAERARRRATGRCGASSSTKG